MYRHLLLALALALVAGPARAECYFEGTRYDEGEVVAGHVCTNGEWQKL